MNNNCSFLSKLDYLSDSPQMLINSKSTMKTEYGGILSVIYFVVVLFSCYFFGKEMILKSDPKHNVSEEFISNTESILRENMLDQILRVSVFSNYSELVSLENLILETSFIYWIKERENTTLSIIDYTNGTDYETYWSYLYLKDLVNTSMIEDMLSDSSSFETYQTNTSSYYLKETVNISLINKTNCQNEYLYCIDFSDIYLYLNRKMNMKN